MRLADIFSIKDLPQPEFKNYLREINPQIDATRLYVRRMVVGVTPKDFQIDDGVTGALGLEYKNRLGGVLTIAEDGSGETWKIPCVQGVKSSKSYRLSTGVEWEKLLAEDLLNHSKRDGAIVRRIIMPGFYDITNIRDAASANIQARYGRVINALNMQWSREENQFVLDLK